MSRYTGPKNKLSRREGHDLFGKGNKLRRATQTPGQHGPKGSRRKTTDYGLQLREKQKVRRTYGIMEKQFRKYFETAIKTHGKTGEKVLELLESRLDNVVYRLGFVPTRNMARQIVGHSHVKVNNSIVNIPSYQVKSGDLISLTDKAVKIPVISDKLSKQDITTPAWLVREGANGKVQRLPSRSDIDTPANEQLIVEFYSR